MLWYVVVQVILVLLDFFRDTNLLFWLHLNTISKFFWFRALKTVCFHVFCSRTQKAAISNIIYAAWNHEELYLHHKNNIGGGWAQSVQRRAAEGKVLQYQYSKWIHCTDCSSTVKNQTSLPNNNDSKSQHFISTPGPQKKCLVSLAYQTSHEMRTSYNRIYPDCHDLTFHMHHMATERYVTTPHFPAD